jgi:hypothetical protein
MTRVAPYYLAGVLTFICADPVLGQESKSAALAKQFASALDAAKLDSVAAKDPATAGAYVGALYVPGALMLVVSAQYSAPALLDARLSKKEYRDVYIELNSASVPGTKLLIEDSGGDGLRARREDNKGFDSIDDKGKRTMFDNQWDKQKLSERDYLNAFGTADEHYVRILTLLLAELKKTS